MNNQSGYPDDNPKTVLGVTKAPLHLVPPAAKYHLAAAFADGAVKYGPYNWRDKTVSASIYVAAAQRHIDAFWDGEDLSQDAKVHHLGHAMACLSILLDAMSVGKLNDDRPTKGASPVLHKEYEENKKKESNAANKYEVVWEIPNYTSGKATTTNPQVFRNCQLDTNRASDPVVNSRVLHVQEDLFPTDAAGAHLPVFRGFDGTYEYWEQDGRVGRYDPEGNRLGTVSAISRLFRGGGAAFNPLYDLTERDSGGTIPVATRDGDS